MDAAFDLQTEVANLARRIVGPVAAKVAQKELDTAVGQICHASNNSTARAPAQKSTSKTWP